MLALVAAGADLDVEVTPLEMATTTARKLLSEDPPSVCDARAAKPFARVRELVAKMGRSR